MNNIFLIISILSIMVNHVDAASYTVANQYNTNVTSPLNETINIGNQFPYNSTGYTITGAILTLQFFGGSSTQQIGTTYINNASYWDGNDGSLHYSQNAYTTTTDVIDQVNTTIGGQLVAPSDGTSANYYNNGTQYTGASSVDLGWVSNWVWNVNGYLDRGGICGPNDPDGDSISCSYMVDQGYEAWIDTSLYSITQGYKGFFSESFVLDTAGLLSLNNNLKIQYTNTLTSGDVTLLSDSLTFNAIANVPEPSSLALLFSGLIGVCVSCRKIC